MSDSPKVPDPVRRGLLTGGAVAFAASAAGMSAGAAPPVEPAAEPQPEDRSKLTYRVTDHIAAYYRRARG